MSRAKHRRITLRRKISRGITALTAVTLLGVGATGYIAYTNLNNNITSVDTTEALGDDRPVAVPVSRTETYQPLNILLVGSDSREGSDIAGETPGLADTTILLHINASRTAITGVSIPRDSMVQRPDCLNPDGTTIASEFDQFNEAFAIGGIGCTQRTVEQLTGIRTDHFAVINLAGFEDMVDAIDGVPICVPQEINDDIGKIYLPAGTYNATGEQALGYVRERHVSSPNGDLGRMKRQQTFLAAMARKVLSSETLTNPARLYDFLDAATKSLTTNPDLASISELSGLAREISGLDASGIRFLSIPTLPYPEDPNRLIWAPEADEVWEALRNDEPLPQIVRETVTSADTVTPSTGKDDNVTREPDDNGLCT